MRLRVDRPPRLRSATTSQELFIWTLHRVNYDGATVRTKSMVLAYPYGTLP